MFSKLVLHNWRQFEQIDIDFHQRLTILTGANGSGKTTLLHLLNRHWGWNIHFVASPHKSSKRRLKRYWAGFWGEGDDIPTPNETIQQPPKVPPRPSEPGYSIGELRYHDGKRATLVIPGEVAEVFAVSIHGMPRVNGVYVPSHRAPYVFQQVTEIPTKLDAKAQIFQVYLAEMIARYTASTAKRVIPSPSYQVKRSLISLATFGYGNAAVEKNDEAIGMFEGFQKILHIMLPKSLGFKKLLVRVPDVLLVTDTGEFSFEAASGGIAAIIDMAWQIFMYSQIHAEFVIVIDEPETHLHPALQQRLLPDLLEAFPKSQVIVATHNPLMVTSVPDSNVYVLNYNPAKRVESELLSLKNKAGTADEILREVLGVPSSLPEWAKKQIDSIMEEFTKAPLTQDSVNALRTKMAELGMEKIFPKVLADVAGGKP